VNGCRWLVNPILRGCQAKYMVSSVRGWCSSEIMSLGLVRRSIGGKGNRDVADSSDPLEWDLVLSIKPI
jgi:hypothetical protein